MDALFIATALAELALLGALVLSWRRPQARIWPPPGPGSWQLRGVWTLCIASGLGAIAVGILDWNTFVLSHPSRIPAGGLLIVGGNVLAFWGAATIGGRATSGLESHFVPAGPYRWTRNPQYIGDIAVLVGWALMANSLRTWGLCLLGSLAFALTPRAEEPWLREKYGLAYEDYRRRVPRFFSWSLSPGRRGAA